MQTLQQTSTESAIWNRLLAAAGKGFTLEAARSILRLDFAQEDKVRMRELAARARAGSLTAAEQNDTREYERAGNLLALMKSRARQRLKTSSRSNGSERG